MPNRPEVPPVVPPPRTPGRYRLAVVCLGNICRSPVADVVLRASVSDAGLEDRIEVVSAGTGDWHIGEPMDRRAAASLRSAGYDGSRHRAQQVRASWLEHQDLVLAMDRSNLEDLRSLAGAGHERVRLFGDFDPDQPGAEVPDPYFGGPDGFRVVLTMVERTADSLLAAITAALEPSAE